MASQRDETTPPSAAPLPLPGAPPLSAFAVVSSADCWHWLAAGWNDLRRHPWASLTYGALFPLAGWGLAAALEFFDALYLLTPMIAGFLLVAPVLAVGLYELSRRWEQGEGISLWGALMVWRRNTFHLLTAGLVLMLFFMIWVRLAALIFAVSFPYTNMTFAGISQALWSLDGAIFLTVGTAVGGAMATVAFVFGAISLPMMVDRRVDIFTAAFTSAVAVMKNPRPMLIWAALLAGFGAMGLMTLFVGLVVVLPLLGHASWHAYRGLVCWPPQVPAEQTSG